MLAAMENKVENSKKSFSFSHRIKLNLKIFLQLCVSNFLFEGFFFVYFEPIGKARAFLNDSVTH